MKTPKLIRKAREYFDPEKIRQKNQKKNLKELLKKLKKKQKKLKEKMAKEKDKKEKKRIGTDIDIIQAQRKKGIDLLKSLRN
jgi:predicted  nucleic acid-binding Zn-ribbon protein